MGAVAGATSEIWMVGVKSAEGASCSLAVTLAADGRPMALRKQWVDLGFFGTFRKDVVSAAVGRAVGKARPRLDPYQALEALCARDWPAAQLH